MKKLLILPIIAFLTGCDTDDDGYYNVAYVRSADPLIEVVPQDVYEVGDDLFVTFFVPYELSEVGNPLPIDVNKTTGNASSYEASFYLEKQVGNEWQIVDITGDVTPTVGAVETGYFALAKASDTGTGYSFGGNLALTETGNFRLLFSTNNDDGSLATIRSKSTGNNLILNIYSTVTNSANGAFNFTVN